MVTAYSFIHSRIFHVSVTENCTITIKNCNIFFLRIKAWYTVAFILSIARQQLCLSKTRNCMRRPQDGALFHWRKTVSAPPHSKRVVSQSHLNDGVIIQSLPLLCPNSQGSDQCLVWWEDPCSTYFLATEAVWSASFMDEHYNFRDDCMSIRKNGVDLSMLFVRTLK